MNSNYHGAVNLGNTKELSILELSKIINDKFNSNLGTQQFPLPQDDPERRMPDIKLAKKIINWQPSINIEQGLDRTINYYKKAI